MLGMSGFDQNDIALMREMTTNDCAPSGSSTAPLLLGVGAFATSKVFQVLHGPTQRNMAVKCVDWRPPRLISNRTPLVIVKSELGLVTTSPLPLRIDSPTRTVRTATFEGTTDCHNSNKPLEVTSHQQQQHQQIPHDDRLTFASNPRLVSPKGSINSPTTVEACPFIVTVKSVFDVRSSAEQRQAAGANTSARSSCFIVMDEVMDGSLDDLIARDDLQATTEKVCRAVAFQALHGLVHLHENARRLHGNIKPTNILFRSADGHVKLGLSNSETIHSFQTAAAMRWFQKGRHYHPCCYMSPCAFENGGCMSKLHNATTANVPPLHTAADLWALGVTIAQLALGGQLPFTAKWPNDIAKLRDVPPCLPDNGSFSESFRNFIIKVCDPSNEKETLSASQILAHPWLDGFSLEDSQRVIANL